MLLQPFVENAIIHGFREQKKNGLIIIKFWTSADQLHCIVKDNGRGRQRAKRKGHTSKALEITQKRLKLIEEQTRKPTEFKITDLTGDQGEPIGTKVYLAIPLL
jgi:LytS/YehU family sensor histidine kinase